MWKCSISSREHAVGSARSREARSEALAMVSCGEDAILSGGFRRAGCWFRDCAKAMEDCRGGSSQQEALAGSAALVYAVFSDSSGRHSTSR